MSGDVGRRRSGPESERLSQVLKEHSPGGGGEPDLAGATRSALRRTAAIEGDRLDETSGSAAADGLVGAWHTSSAPGPDPAAEPPPRGDADADYGEDC